MGPAPMIRMVEMSVLLGIKSQRLEFGHKKRARMPRVPRAKAPGFPLARRRSLDQISQPRKGFRAAINRQFGWFSYGEFGWLFEGSLGPSPLSPTLFELRRDKPLFGPWWLAEPKPR